MTRILLDANIVLDVLLDRQPYSKSSSAVWTAIERQSAQGYLAAHAVTTIFYLARKKQGLIQARKTVDALLRVFSIAPVDEAVLREATHSSLSDFEDAVTAAAARASGWSLIVSRDSRGFRSSPIRCLPPEAVLPLLAP